MGKLAARRNRVKRTVSVQLIPALTRAVSARRDVDGAGNRHDIDRSRG
jgi:hypothetical protein